MLRNGQFLKEPFNGQEKYRQIFLRSKVTEKTYKNMNGIEKCTVQENDQYYIYFVVKISKF